MDFEKIDIHELLPQREPFIMIGFLLHFDMERIVTCTEIKGDNMFVEDERLSSAGIIENIAQTCAARIGYINKYILKCGINIGYIGAIRNLVIHRLPRIGEMIETTVVVESEVFGMTLVSAKVTSGAETIAETEMKIAVSDVKSQS